MQREECNEMMQEHDILIETSNDIENIIINKNQTELKTLHI